jgi:hypothetical protein
MLIQTLQLKCDAYLDPENPCSRCRKLCLRCFRLAGFQRLEVRKYVFCIKKPFTVSRFIDRHMFAGQGKVKAFPMKAGARRTVQIRSINMQAAPRHQEPVRGPAVAIALSEEVLTLSTARTATYCIRKPQIHQVLLYPAPSTHQPNLDVYPTSTSMGRSLMSVFRCRSNIRYPAVVPLTTTFLVFSQNTPPSFPFFHPD